MICPSCGYVNLAGAEQCESCEDSLLEAESARPHLTALEESVETDRLSALHPHKPVTVEPGARVRDVVQLLADNDIGCVLVTFSGSLVGIFSERDVLMRIGDRLEELADEPIRHFMTPAPEALTADDSIAFALNRMALCDFRHIPIEADERAVGIISVRDMLRYTAQQFPEVLAPTS